MKPATVGLFAFLSSLLRYTVIGIFLVGIINSGNFGPTGTDNYEAAIGVSIVASFITGYVAWYFESE